MPNPSPEQLKAEPVHKWLDHTNLFVGGGMFTFLLRSGGDFQIYVMSPDHTKQIAKLFTKKVEEYEKENGPLIGRLSDEPMESPIRMNPGDGPFSPPRPGFAPEL